MTDNRTSPSGKRVEATVDSVAEIREFTNNPPNLVWLKGGGGFDRYEHTTEVDDGVNTIVVGNFVFMRRREVSLNGTPVSSVNTDASIITATANGVAAQRVAFATHMSLVVAKAQLSALLGAKLVDIWAPENSTLSGANVTGCPSSVAGGNALSEAHTSDYFTLADYNGRKVWRSLTNTGKRLYTAAGTTAVTLACAKFAVAPGSYAVLVSGTGAGNTAPELMISNGSSDLWYSYNISTHRCNGAANYYLYQNEWQVYSITGGPATGVCVGGISAAARDWLGDIGLVVRCNAALTDAEYFEAARIMRAYQGLPSIVPLILDGNSLTDNAYFNTQNKSKGRFSRDKKAVTGAPTTTILADLANTLPGRDYGEMRKLYCLWEITNDLGTLGVSAATAIANVYACADYAKSLGYRVVLGDCMARDDAAWSPAKETSRNAVNADLAANWQLHADAFFTVNQDARLMTPTNGTYFNADKLHLTAAGYQIANDLRYAAIEAAALLIGVT